MNPKKRTKRSNNLSDQIRRTVSSSAPSKIEVIQQHDSIDPDISAYVSDFLRDFSSLEPLEPISLLTPESAQAALVSLAQTQQKIEAQMRTAQALKRMLKSIPGEN